MNSIDSISHLLDQDNSRRIDPIPCVVSVARPESDSPQQQRTAGRAARQLDGLGVA
ncbi:hypothetical protein VTN00DRAFT_7903 [Thermoascus crustaceus]|uniref:uncharacterized protein n=1 Tax=Thermoascus crustaceus TaxID=5088 RepID=UPI0037448BD8